MSGPKVSLPWRVTLAALRRLPQGVLSRGFGWLADRPLPRWTRRTVLGGFAGLVGVDRSEAEEDVTQYPSLNAFFVRRLKPGLRAWPSDPSLLTSPVDGVVGAFGTIRDGGLTQAKGLHYGASELLGEAVAGSEWEGGLFITVYLSPRHYHRIHTPLPGRVVAARHVPGALMPVNQPAVASVDRLFARNERLVAHLESAVGRVAVVAVGAYNVGRISAAFDANWSGQHGTSITNRGDPPEPVRDYGEGIRLEAGAELMAFHLGSTIILLAPPGLEMVEGTRTGQDVEVGEVLARPRS